MRLYGKTLKENYGTQESKKGWSKVIVPFENIELINIVNGYYKALQLIAIFEKYDVGFDKTRTNTLRV